MKRVPPAGGATVSKLSFQLRMKTLQHVEYLRLWTPSARDWLRHGRRAGQCPSATIGGAFLGVRRRRAKQLSGNSKPSPPELPLGVRGTRAPTVSGTSLPVEE